MRRAARMLRSLHGLRSSLNEAHPAAAASSDASRPLHSSAATWLASNPADRLPEDLLGVDEREEAARSEVDVEVDIENSSTTIATATAAREPSSLSLDVPDLSSSTAHHRRGSVSVPASVGDREWIFESGKLARLANGAATLRCGGTTVLATASTGADQVNRREVGSAPLTVEYREKLYAVARIPGSYNKREGAPKEHEVLAARRLERAVRPLFPRGYSYPTDITASVLSADREADPEALAMNAASAALAASEVPCGAPLGAARVAVVAGRVVVSPTMAATESAELVMLVAATEDRVVLLEADGDEVSEESFLEALRAGVEAARATISAQRELAAAAGRGKRAAQLAGADPAAARRVAEVARAAVSKILRSGDVGCIARSSALVAAKAHIVETMRAAGCWRSEFARVPGSGCVTSSDVDHAFSAAIGAELRSMAVEEGLRPDGRGPIDLRPVSIHMDHVPVVHGSAVFELGDTQAMCTATIGGKTEQQRIESLLGGEGTKRLFVHFSLPDFATVGSGAEGARGGGGGVGPIVRHEMDRSSFVERALLPVMPPEALFPFAVRLNADALAADGGTAAAAVSCGSLALADAGVPLKALVAAVGVGMASYGGAWSGELGESPPSAPSAVFSATDGEADGGAKEWCSAWVFPDPGQYELLTDPSGMEVTLGDMELRVAGTAAGITACQLDVRIPGGVPLAALEEALARARVGRLRVLAAMEAALPADRAGNAPRFGIVRVPPSSVGQVVGREGSVIRKIESTTGAKVNIGNGGELGVFAPSAAALEAATSAIQAITGGNLENGKLYAARVVAVKDFGAFMQLPGSETQAFLHVSEIAKERIRAVEDVLKVGDVLEVMFMGRDNRGSLRVSRKAALEQQKI